MPNHLIAANEDDAEQAVYDLKEFDEEELRRLGEKGITPHHLARFLEALRNNLDPSSLGRFLSLLEESQEQDECPCTFV